MKFKKRISLVMIGLVLSIMIVLVGCTPSNETTGEIEINELISQEDVSNMALKLQETLVFVSDVYPPYVIPTGDDKGFYTDLIYEVFENQGIDVIFEYYPWTRGVELVHSGEVFATYPWLVNSDRLRDFSFSNSFYSSRSIIAYMDDNDKIIGDYKEIEDLRQYNLGTVSSYYYIEELKGLGFDLDSSDTEEEALKKLFNGRYDVLIINEQVYDSLVENLYPDKRNMFMKMDAPYREIYHAFRTSKDYPNQVHYISLFNNGLKDLIEDGRYEQLLDKYNLPKVDMDNLLLQYNTKSLIIGLEDYAPYEYVNEDKEIVGIGVDLIKEALARLGYSERNYEFVVYPWSRIMEMGAKGELDIILDAFYTKTRDEMFEYSEEVYVESKYYFITLNGDLDFDGKSFSQPVETIGLVRGYQYGETIKNLLDDYEIIIDEMSTTNELMKGLLNKRYDVIIEGEMYSKFYMKEHGREETLNFLWEPLDSLKSYIMVPRENGQTELLNKIDQKIRELRREGTDKYIERFYLK